MGRLYYGRVPKLKLSCMVISYHRVLKLDKTFHAKFALRIKPPI